MTRAAGIPQAEIERVLRAATREAPDARVIIDHRRQRIEIILSPADSARDREEPNPWEED